MSLNPNVESRNDCANTDRCRLQHLFYTTHLLVDISRSRAMEVWEKEVRISSELVSKHCDLCGKAISNIYFPLNHYNKDLYSGLNKRYHEFITSVACLQWCTYLNRITYWKPNYGRDTLIKMLITVCFQTSLHTLSKLSAWSYFHWAL